MACYGKGAQLQHADESMERAVLGAVLLRPSLGGNVLFRLTDQDFAIPANMAVYRAMKTVAGAGKEIDILHVERELKNEGWNEAAENLITYAADCPSLERVDQYISTLLELSGKRRIAAICADIASRVYLGDSLSELTSELMREVSKEIGGQDSGTVVIGDIMPRVLEEICSRVEAASGMRKGFVLKTGVTALDDVLVIRPGNLTVIAADSGGGKTALAMQILHNHCKADNHAGICANLEMTTQELVERMIVMDARLDSHDVAKGQLDLETYKNDITRVSEKIAQMNITFATRVRTASDFVYALYAWRARNPHADGLAILDFLQLVQGEKGSKDNRARELGIIVRDVKAAAKHLMIPIILVSQYNRAYHARGGAPTMTDLKDSGDIEQAADQILLIYNDEQTDDGDLSIIIGKNRHGPCKTIRAHWVARWYSFVDSFIK